MKQCKERTQGGNVTGRAHQNQVWFLQCSRVNVHQQPQSCSTLNLLTAATAPTAGRDKPHCKGHRMGKRAAQVDIPKIRVADGWKHPWPEYAYLQGILLRKWRWQQTSHKKQQPGHTRVGALQRWESVASGGTWRALPGVRGKRGAGAGCWLGWLILEARG